MNFRKRILAVQPLPVVAGGLELFVNEAFQKKLCLTATRVDHAREMLITKKPEIVIVDPFMEKGAGLVFLQDLVKFAPKPLGIVFASHIRVDDLPRFFQAGAAAVVSHREPAPRIIQALLAVCEGEKNVVAISSEEAPCRAAGQVSHERLQKLPAKLRELFDLLGQSISLKEITARMKLSSSTIESYLGRLKEKLGLPDNAAVRHSAIAHSVRQEDEARN